MDDGKIIALFFARSEQAIKALAAKYGRLLFQIARNITGDDGKADECVNDTYLGVWNAIPPASPNPLSPYVCRIARNLSLKRVRYDTAEKRNSAYDLSLDELAECLPSPSAEEVWSSEQLGKLLNRFLSTLSSRDQVIFTRRYWFGNSVQEIARIVGMRPGSISARLSRMRTRLRTDLEKEGIFV